MPAAKYDIIIEQGGTYEIEFQLKLETAGGNAPYTLWNNNLYGSVRSTYGSTPKEDFIIPIMDANQGIFRLKLIPNQTNRLVAGKNVYDVELHNVADNGELQVIRLLEGVATVTPSVTTQR